MEKTGGVIEIALSHINQNNTHYLKMEVLDEGGGVPEEYRKNLFKPFFTMRSKGIGLGLNVCAKVAQKHGWEIDYQPRNTKGSIFRILIPEQNSSVTK
jgi:signal transduction histidine kinase